MSAPAASIGHAGAVESRARGSLRPVMHGLSRLIRPLPDIVTQAVEQWMIAPATTVEVRPALGLPGQIDRIAGTCFGSYAEVTRDLRGGFASVQPPTMGYRLRDVLLYDGVLHGQGAWRHFRARRHIPALGRWREYGDVRVMYESWAGNRWFGNWLADDCVTYPLCAGVGRPVTSRIPSGHVEAYERALGMSPDRVDAAWFDELVLFDDRGHGDSRRLRADDLRRRLTGGAATPHPGVFLLRGKTGDRRIMHNEGEVADRLAARGFRVIDPSFASIETIIGACAGARIVAGVEGSHLVHGLMTMPPDAGLFVIQPPDRAVSVLKLVTDCQGQDFGFVVGKGSNEGFRADVDEIEHTLDLF
ncbi:glycosyltransferase 61 family protein [Sphingomonas sp. IW22]